jgi:uncharacterized protein YecE (DUF72 family)
MRFRLGCAVWAFQGWRGDFFPADAQQNSMLSLYSRRMTTVEGNSVFYGVPSSEVLAKWSEQTPDEFRFCPKIPRAISHEGDLTPEIPQALRFFDHMHAGLGHRLGPIFLQLPPSYSPHLGPDLARFLNAWRRHTGHPLLVEVRHPRWYVGDAGERLDTLLSRLSLGRVVLDTRAIYSGDDDPQIDNPRKKPKLPIHAVSVGNLAMVRFISHPDADRNLRLLHEWATIIHRWLSAGKEVYFFMHCPREEFSPEIARMLQRMLEEQGAPVPPLLWDSLPPEPQQQGMF